jgi:hypothetical protein
VLSPNEGMVESSRLSLGQDEGPACAVGESFKRGPSLAREVSADPTTPAQSSMPYVSVTGTVLVTSPASMGIDAALPIDRPTVAARRTTLGLRSCCPSEISKI